MELTEGHSPFGGPCTDPGSHSLRRVVRDEMPDTDGEYVVWLALSWPRARSFRLLLLVRRACVIGLACHCWQCFRWIPSECNPAGAPSHVYDRGKDGNKSSGFFQHQNFSVNTGQGLHKKSDQSIVSSHQSCISTTPVAPSCPGPPAVSPASMRGPERVPARRLNEKQDESGSDEAAAEGDDTKYALAEWVTAGNFSHGDASERAGKPRPQPSANWETTKTFSRAASFPWPPRLWSRPSFPCNTTSNKWSRSLISQVSPGFTTLCTWRLLSRARKAFVNLVGSIATKVCLAF